MQSRPPQVDKLLRNNILLDCQSRYRRSVVVKVIRGVLADSRRQENNLVSEDEFADKVVRELEKLASPSLRKVINGTGIVLNTNLGRAPLSAEYISALSAVVSGYCNLEYDLNTGKRGKRSSSLQKLLQILTGAEASVVVNNNAAAIVLAVNCFASGKEVIVSRGELIEIGGSFRLPDVIEAAGGILKEVGTTNKTRISDFEKAIGSNTGLIMRCHRSNFELKGFTEETELAQLVDLCARKQVPFVEDLGSGALANMADFGLAEEPTVEDTLAAGCDMVTFSGDKLLGGPQAGLIAGKKIYIDQLAAHPLYRALRLDKVSIFLLEQTLKSYLLARPQDSLPGLAMMAADAGEIKNRVERFIETNAGNLTLFKLGLIETKSAVGGGSMPGQEKFSFGISLKTNAQEKGLANDISAALRKGNPPVIALTRDNETIIDFRTVANCEEAALLSSLQQAERKISEKVAESAV